MQVPPQHGAWAFLAVPLILASFLGAATWVGLLFAVTWVTAYPATYYLGRGVIARLRRGSWTTRARSEMAACVPWAVVCGVGAIALVVLRPWIVVPGVVVVALWVVSSVLAYLGRERAFGNDLLLVALAAIAVPLMWCAATGTSTVGEVPGGVWLAAFVSLVFFVGSVIHVKSLIREARDRRWRLANIVFHVAALGMAAISWWLLVPFGAALARSLVLRPGVRPGRIGAVEAVVSVLVVVGTLLAVGAG